MSQASTCCFSGHRKLPKDRIEHIAKCLEREIESLIGQGVENFISGGALGFDQIAASLVIAKKELGWDIRLIFALPCKDQARPWSADQKKHYHSLLAKADAVCYLAEEYYDGCMKKRNCFMVDQSDCCICALLYTRGGTAQTVKYAQEKGLRIINVAE